MPESYLKTQKRFVRVFFFFHQPDILRGIEVRLTVWIQRIMVAILAKGAVCLDPYVVVLAT